MGFNKKFNLIGRAGYLGFADQVFSTLLVAASLQEIKTSTCRFLEKK
jgi:hypothetical protein